MATRYKCARLHRCSTSKQHHKMSDSEIDKFLAEWESKNKSALDPWESQIFELLAKNASYEKIQRFLKTKNVNAERGNIARFAKAKKRAHLYAKAMAYRNQHVIGQQSSSPQPASPSPADKKHPEKTVEVDCCRRPKTDPPGVRRKTWTGLCCKSKALAVFDGTERAKRYLDAFFVIPADVRVNDLNEFFDSCVHPFPRIEQLRF